MNGNAMKLNLFGNYRTCGRFTIKMCSMYHRAHKIDRGGKAIDDISTGFSSILDDWVNASFTNMNWYILC